MVEFIRGDILKAEAEALVNPVNCVGVMGRGLALEFKRAFPENFRAYAEACKREEVQPGRMYTVDLGRGNANPRYIINFPTKRHWRGMSRMADIESGLEALVVEARRLSLRSLAIPALGCGLGGLNWSAVRRLIVVALDALPEARALVYEPV